MFSVSLRDRGDGCPHGGAGPCAGDRGALRGRTPEA